jgi:hypothetical protein
MPKQDITVRQLVDKVLTGELTLPEMQRRYVWTAIKVRDLLDSLYRSYPSGTILVWETDQIMNDSKLHIGGVSTSQFNSKLLLLDGQQRLTSLTAILSGNPVAVRNKRKPIDIYFNLEHPDNMWEDEISTDIDDDDEEEDDEEDDDAYEIMGELRKRTFVVASKSLKNDPSWISVTDIFKKSDSQLLKPVGINSENPLWDKYSERIKTVRKIEDYSYVMQILDKKMSYEEVTEIFVRVNSLGVKLRGSDLATAQITSRWRGFMKETEEFAKEFENNEDYLHETGILIKTLVVFATNQSRYKTVGRILLENFKSAWEKTKKGLRFAINYLKSNVGIDNLNLLSSPFLIIPIAFLSVEKGEKLSESEDQKLLLWFYVAHMKGHYSYGSSESFLDADISIINKSGSIEKLLDVLKLHVKEFYVSTDELKGKSRRSPFFSMLFFLAKQRGVKDWFTGIRISEKLIGRSHALQFHHIFPKALLRDLDIDRKNTNDISNLAFINGKTNRSISNKKPENYLDDVIKKRGRESLTSQNIPLNESEWKLSNYIHFLENRRELLAEEINKCIRILSN